MGRRRSKKLKRAKQKSSKSRGTRKSSAKKSPSREVSAKKAETPIWKRTWFLVVIACLLIVLAFVLWYFVLRSPEPKSEEKVMQWSEPPAMEIDPTKKYAATMGTEKGDIVLDLFADKRIDLFAGPLLFISHFESLFY